MKKQAESDRYSIGSVDKALSVLENLSIHGQLSLTELTELMQAPKTSLYRVLQTLEKRGYIKKSGTGHQYRLGEKLLELTKRILDNSLQSAATKEMQKLSDKYGDTINLGILDDHEVVYIDIIESRYPLKMVDQVGSRSPFHAAALGKVQVAFLPENVRNSLIHSYELKAYTRRTITDKDELMNELYRIREQGYALDDEEIVQGARCVAAPIFDISGEVVGAISLSGPVHRFPDEAIETIAKDVMQAARNISKNMGYVEMS